MDMRLNLPITPITITIKIYDKGDPDMLRLKKREKEESSVYEIMLEQLWNTYVGTDIIEKALSPDDLQKQSLPKRYRLIALGFLKGQSLEELNDNLINNGCQPLYSRSSFEATLIYAFANRLSYQEWKKIATACEKAQDYWRNNWETGPRFFQGKQITFGELEKYVIDYSQMSGERLITRQLTRVLNDELCALGDDGMKFFQFYISNLKNFSDVREKARYYFCKYLYYYLLEKIDRYKKVVGDHMPNQEQLMILLPLKAESKLRRRKTNPQDLLSILRESAISPAALFEEFNYYFFEYVSLDWVELMLENVMDINDLKESEIEKIAAYLRANVSKKKIKDIMGDSDKDLVYKYIYRLQKEEADVTVSRKGENAIRKYLKGELDIDRTTLICFLLFLGSEETNRNKIKISQERLNEILDECGFSMLRRKEAFDAFVMKYIASDDPVSFLMEEMDEYLKRGETFFIHEVYAGSSSNAKEIRRQMSL